MQAQEFGLLLEPMFRLKEEAAKVIE